MHYFFFRELQLITVLILICNFYSSLSTKFISLKLCVGFSIFYSVSFLLKFIFLFNKKHGLFDFKNVIIPFKMKTIANPHTVLLLNLWFLSCNKKFKNFMISVCELELPKNWPGDEFFKLRKLKFWVRHIFFNSIFYINIWHSFTPQAFYFF